jgi:N-acetyltransferase
VSIPPLSPDLTRDVLLFLGVDIAPTSVAHLDTLITAYTEAVPWESFSRIARRARVADTADCPRWPEIFWREAMELGGGSTCFESNYAFFSLLCALGYDGYLTINNMGETVGCHSAIVLNIDGKMWLADAGLPLYVALPLDPAAVTQRSSRFHTYTVRPDGINRYQIERDFHPKPIAFTLLDLPVDNDPYRQRMTDDYGENGIFLDMAIVVKVVDGQVRRFNSAEEPPKIQVFENGERSDYEITVDIAEAISRQFGMDEDVVRAALDVLEK